VVARLSALDRKLVRDLWHLRGQVAAIGVVVACGVATVVTTRTSYSSLLASRAAYYRDYRFADVFAHLTRAPETLRQRIRAIPGVAAVETRVVTTVTLDVPGLAEPATGQLVSVPEPRTPILNDVHLRRGRWPEAGRADEAMVSEAFAVANQLDLGATLGAVINGRWQRVRIVGLAISPEFVYEIRPGGLFPDSRRFGVLWMSREVLAAAFDMVGSFNDVSLALAPGAVEADVVAALDRLLDRYGGLGAYGRRDQVSARFLADEIAQNRVSGTIIPAIFLGIAAFLLNVVMARLVSTEREQIGVLKAFGYGDWTVGWHYLKLALVALALGAVVGTGLGLWLAARTNARYAQYYRFPEFLFRLDWTAVAIAVMVTVVAALTGAAGAVRRVVALPPATAMQAEQIARYRPGILERLGLEGLFAAPGRIVVRNLERRPMKAALSALGIAFAVAILMVGRFFVDSMVVLADVQFRQVQQENLTVVFNAPRSAAVRYGLTQLPGVLRAEGFRSVPVRLRHGHKSRLTAILGLEHSGELRRLVGRTPTPVALPPDGLVLTTKLGEVLDVSPGDTLDVDVLEGARPVRRAVVAAFVDELLGLSAYMDQAALNRLMREGNTLSGAFLRVDSYAAPALYERLKRLPAVASVASRDAMLASFKATLAQSIGIVTIILVGSASALAVAVVYNAARIALSERARELASLRVLGFTRAEISLILLGEQAVLAFAGIAAGLGIGYGSCAVLSRLYQWEMFRLPLVLSAQTYGFALTVILAASAASALLVRRRLDRLDLVAVLKTRE
jgi:putative ABC transport system permease protein